MDNSRIYFVETHGLYVHIERDSLSTSEQHAKAYYRTQLVKWRMSQKPVKNASSKVTSVKEYHDTTDGQPYAIIERVELYKDGRHKKHLPTITLAIRSVPNHQTAGTPENGGS